jgi:hypothetical protein
MPSWVAVLLTAVAGIPFSLAAAGIFISSNIRKIQGIEVAKPDFVILRRWGLWSKPGFHWYFRRSRDRRCFLYGILGGLLAALPIVLYSQSVVLAILVPVVGAILAEALSVLGLDYVGRPRRDVYFAVVEIPCELVAWKNRLRVARDGATYLQHCVVTSLIGSLYFLAVTLTAGNRLGPRPGVLAGLSGVTAQILGPILSILVVMLWWNRKFVVTRTQMAITAALLANADSESSDELEAPVRLADASYQVRKRLTEVASLLPIVARRLANSHSAIPITHPLAVVLWGVSDRIVRYLGTPASLTAEVPNELIALLKHTSAVMAGPNRPDAYKELITDDAIFEADWSNRMGGSGSRAIGRFVAAVEHVDRVRKGTVALAIVAAIVIVTILAATGHVNLEKAVVSILHPS